MELSINYFKTFLFFASTVFVIALELFPFSVFTTVSLFLILPFISFLITMELKNVFYNRDINLIEDLNSYDEIIFTFFCGFWSVFTIISELFLNYFYPVIKFHFMYFSYGIGLIILFGIFLATGKLRIIDKFLFYSFVQFFALIPICLLVILHYRYGSEYLFLLLLVTKVVDAFSMIIGVNFPYFYYGSISPNKTLSGFIGGLLCSIIIILIFKHFMIIPNFSILFILFMIFLGQTGDLICSAIKREALIKNFNSFYFFNLPGIGGALDVFDSIVPVIYLLFSIL